MRYLSQNTKLPVLEAWMRSFRNATALSGNRPTSPGDPDPDIVAWCLRLNSIPGVCTLQSCAGHRDGNVLSAGHLWLWLDQRMAHLCNEHAPQLAAHSPLIEQVSRLYMSDGQEVFAVTFQGNERDSLAASMELVCTFVERMAASAD